jgi:hypothetical protein
MYMVCCVTMVYLIVNPDLLQSDLTFSFRLSPNDPSIGIDVPLTVTLRLEDKSRRSVGCTNLLFDTYELESLAPGKGNGPSLWLDHHLKMVGHLFLYDLDGSWRRFVRDKIASGDSREPNITAIQNFL